jgi:GT2 family glycosyltransferase
MKNTSDPFEIIIVDQGSSDSTLDYLKGLQNEHGNIRVLSNNRNVGFAAGCNQGARIAKGDILVFLNNDVIVPHGWLSGLRKPLVDDLQLAGTGPVSNATGELQFDNESVDKVKKLPQDVESYAEIKRTTMSGKLWYFHRLAGFCLVVRRAAFEDVGGFNESLTFFEDDYLCHSLIARGNRLAIVPSVFVYHFGSASFKAADQNVDLLMQVNRPRFLRQLSDKSRVGIVGEAKVSVIVTTYNRPRELKEALESILRQTYTNLEAIVVNDGGEDVGSVVRSCSDHRFKYVSTSHLGKPAAANLGVLTAGGKYLAFLDDDDLWYSDHLEVCVDFLEQNPEIGGVYAKSFRKIFTRSPDGRRQPIRIKVEYSTEFDWQRLLQYNWIPIISVVVRKDATDKMNPVLRDLDVMEDWDFLIRFSSVNELVHVPQITSEYYVDAERMSRNELLRKHDWARYMAIVKSIQEFQVALPATSEQLRLVAERLEGLDRPISSYVNENRKPPIRYADERTLSFLDEALRRNPFNYYALLLFVELARMVHDQNRLLTHIERFLGFRPDKAVVWRIYAEELYKMGKVGDALRALGMALLTRENEYQAIATYELMAFCYAKIEMMDSATACMLKSKEIERLSQPSEGHSQIKGGVLPFLSEGVTLDRLFQGGGVGTRVVKALSYYNLYAKRWGHRAALRKMLGHALHGGI